MIGTTVSHYRVIEKLGAVVAGISLLRITDYAPTENPVDGINFNGTAGKRSFLLIGVPIEDKRDRRSHAIVRGEIDQESLTIKGHGVLLPVRARQRTAGNANGKQGHRSPGFERLTIRRQLHWRRHQLVVQRHVEDFLAVLVPTRLCAAVIGNLELSARSGKRPDVDLVPARFVRLICDPLAIGGELALALLKWSLQERERLFIAGDRQYPQVPARLRINAVEQQKASVGGPVVWRFGLIRFQQQFISSSATRQFRVQVVDALSIGVEHNAAPIWRPDWPELQRSIKREPCWYSPDGIDEPDIRIAVDRPIYVDKITIR